MKLFFFFFFNSIFFFNFIGHHTFMFTVDIKRREEKPIFFQIFLVHIHLFICSLASIIILRERVWVSAKFSETIWFWVFFLILRRNIHHFSKIWSIGVWFTAKHSAPPLTPMFVRQDFVKIFGRKIYGLLHFS